MNTFHDELLKNHKESQFVNYYKNHKNIHFILNTINENYKLESHELQDIQHIIYTTSHTINELLKSKKIERNDSTKEVILLSKINKYTDLLKNNNIFKLKRLLRIKSNNEKIIKNIVNEKITYLQFIRKELLKEKEIGKYERQRIQLNSKLFKFGKRKQTKSNQKQIEFPSEKDTLIFWKNIYENTNKVKEIDEIKEILNNTTINQREDTITLEELEYSIKFINNWKSPGIDGIQGFWIKYLKLLHNNLLQLFNTWYNNPKSIPSMLGIGNTVLIFKGGDSKLPQNYRPITCLNIITKLFTSILRNKIVNQLENNNILKQISQEQLGCKKNSYASKEGLLKTTLFQQSLNVSKTNYIQVFYDIQKAFDSVNHEWLIQCLKYYNLPIRLINTITQLMKFWTIQLHYNKKQLGNIIIKKGILQGDSLSPLLFILSIDIVSKQLNKNVQKATIEKRKQKEINKFKLKMIKFNLVISFTWMI